MKKVFLAAVGLATVLAHAASAATESPPKLAREVCSKCHGPEGISQSPLFPRLAGQQAEYLDQQLHQFRDRSRGDPHAQAYMWGVAGPLTDAQIKSISEYYASRKPVHGAAPSDPALAAKGKEIFFNGLEARNVPACAGCHGEQAEGQGAIPRLAGQHADYLYRQLRDFRSELRENETMHANVQSMTDDDAAALTEYLASQ